jgi:hypothetical protein
MKGSYRIFSHGEIRHLHDWSVPSVAHEERNRCVCRAWSHRAAGWHADRVGDRRLLRQLLDVLAETKMMVVITDGQPDEEEIDLLAGVPEQANLFQVQVVGVGIGVDIARRFPVSISVRATTELPEALALSMNDCCHLERRSWLSPEGRANLLRLGKADDRGSSNFEIVQAISASHLNADDKKKGCPRRARGDNKAKREKNVTRFILRFYAPMLLGVIVLAIAIFSPQIIPAGPRVELEVGLMVGVLGLKVPLATWMENAWVIRLIAAIVGVICFAFALCVDFSRFFPRRLCLDVYFDSKGIQRTLRMFLDRELGDVKPAKDWESRIVHYDAEVVAGLNALWATRGTANAPSLQDMGRDLLHAQGEVTLAVQRIALLLYKVASGKGDLQLVLENRDRPVFRFRSEFYLRDTGDNYIRPELLPILRSPTVMLRPEFKQVFQIEKGGADAPFDHRVAAVTKVRLLPTPSFSDTLYLWRDHDGQTVPVAYAIYSSTGDSPEIRGTSF